MKVQNTGNKENIPKALERKTKTKTKDQESMLSDLTRCQKTMP